MFSFIDNFALYFNFFNFDFGFFFLNRTLFFEKIFSNYIIDAICYI